MTTKHTQGPWRVKIPTDGSTHYPHIVDVKYEHVLCRLTDLYCLPDRLDANAQLIAAAPELLEALESLTGMAECFADELHNRHPDVLKAKEVIAKARGEEL